MGGSTLPQVMATLLGARVHEGVHEQRFDAIFGNTAEDQAQAMAMGDVLAYINVDLIHKLRRDNVVRDTLSRRQELQIIFTSESSLMRVVREDYQDDEESKRTLDTLRLGKKLEHFRLERGLSKNACWFPKAS